MANGTKGKKTDAARAQQLITGVNGAFAKGAKLNFAGGTFTPAQVVAQLQLIVNLRQAVNDARAALAAKVAAENAQLPALHVFMAAFVAFVKNAFAGSPDVLATFGETPTTRATPDVATKAAAIAKREATRTARGTKGTKQKKGVKGAVAGVTITPVVANEPGVTAGNAAPNPTGVGGATGGGTPHTA
jgi:hypothetical protein